MIAAWRFLPQKLVKAKPVAVREALALFGSVMGEARGIPAHLAELMQWEAGFGKKG